MNNVLFMYGFMTGVAASFAFIFIVLFVLAKNDKKLKNNTPLDENK